MTKHTHTMRAAAWMLGLALAGAAGSACAASRDEQDHACRGDAFHFCSSDIPNKEKITACMEQHYEELSPSCKAMFKKPSKGGHS